METKESEGYKGIGLHISKFPHEDLPPEGASVSL
jgi:hypothetical protein